jgi:hypothetical protein
MNERQPLTPEQRIWWERVDRKLDGGKDCVHDRVMVRRLFARLLVIPSNQKQLLVRTYAEDSPRRYKVVKSDWEPNPWHADPGHSRRASRRLLPRKRTPGTPGMPSHGHPIAPST